MTTEGLFLFMRGISCSPKYVKIIVNKAIKAQL